MLTLSLIKQFSRLSVCPAPIFAVNSRNISIASVLNFKLTDNLWAEPLKKKKRIDPAIEKAREARRKKKLEKQIRRLEKNARQLKPIEELEVPFNLIDEIKKRKRPQVQLSTEEIEARAVLQKEWGNFKRKEYIANIAQVNRIMAAQRHALDQLYEESEELYNEAIMPDLLLVPYKAKGPVVTPPNKNYDSPDGEYIDVSKKWQDS